MFHLGGKGNTTRIKPELWAAMSNKVSGLNVSSSFPIEPITAKGNGHLTSHLLSIFIGAAQFGKRLTIMKPGRKQDKRMEMYLLQQADGLGNRG